MKRPWHTWFWFGACLVLMLAATAWVTITTVALDRRHRQAEAQARLEEKIRFSLWQMDSLLLPLFIEESARPPALYRAFLPSDGQEAGGRPGPPTSRKLIPSPLLIHTSAFVIIHFDFVPGRRPTSPQVPEEPERLQAANWETSSSRLHEYAQRLERLNSFLQAGQPSRIQDGLFANGVVLFNALPSTADINAASNALYAATALIAPQNDAGAARAPAVSLPVEWPNQERGTNWMAANNPSNPQRSQYLRNVDEFNQRGNVYQLVQNVASANYLNVPAAANDSAVAPLPFKAVWVQDQLFLARRVVIGGQTHVQGCWLHWENIKTSLLEAVREVLPGADLQPLPPGDASAAGRMLAALPVKVVPPALTLKTSTVESPVPALVLTAWMGILLAALAAAFLLHGTISLSERRAAFVSSVTHELRTPLTTFKMYSEMLAEGMVKDEQQQRQYLNTLCAEANRLGHLVENVLAYARLERGSARWTVQKISLGNLIQAVEPRLTQRAAQAGMKLAVDADAATLTIPVRVDVSAVEQILFNLVDNACKYAAPTAAEKVIHLEALPPGPVAKFAMLRVRDHGQGISTEAARRLFEPFGKTAQDAAHSAPGVGLGLALSRNLSRALHGDLHWIASVKPGACFELRLPVSTETA